MQKILRKISTQDFNVNSAPEAFNIVLVGRTGSGKSYFANALLGCLTPDRTSGAGVFFAAKESSNRNRIASYYLKLLLLAKILF